MVLANSAIIGCNFGGVEDPSDDIKITVVVSAEEDQDQWFGLIMEFPLGQINEAAGFGQVHKGK